MKKIILSLFLVSSILLLGMKEMKQEHERWDVKTLTDGFYPDLSNTSQRSVESLEKIKIIRVGYNTPRMDFEKNIITVSGTIVSMRLEKDGDIHIELMDNSIDSTIACEAVDPNDDVVEKSPFLEKFKIVKEKISNLKKGDQVSITGALFQDKFHKPFKMRIRNFLEVHPILIIQ
ncbi:MAG TPA: hypothetical protein VNG53_06765 [Bacteroidia bacterium]|nr:hypothetical protein [Bacteroidia bacterium]